MKNKKLIPIIAVLALIAAVLAAVMIWLLADKFSAEDKETDSGYCGDEGKNVEWVLYEDGEIVISGEGAMANYTKESPAPWYKHRAVITSAKVEDGVTHIGDYAFKDCVHLATITIPETVETIGEGAFEGCDELKEKPSVGQTDANSAEEKNESSQDMTYLNAKLCEHNGYIYDVNLLENGNYIVSKYSADISSSQEIYTCDSAYYLSIYGDSLFIQGKSLYMYDLETNETTTVAETLDCPEIAFYNDTLVYGSEGSIVLYSMSDGSTETVSTGLIDVEDGSSLPCDSIKVCDDYVVVSADSTVAYVHHIKIYSFADKKMLDYTITTAYPFDINGTGSFECNNGKIYYMRANDGGAWSQLYVIQHDIATGEEKRAVLISETPNWDTFEEEAQMAFFDSNIYIITGDMPGSASFFSGTLVYADESDFTFTEIDTGIQLNSAGNEINAVGRRFYVTDSAIYCSACYDGYSGNTGLIDITNPSAPKTIEASVEERYSEGYTSYRNVFYVGKDYFIGDEMTRYSLDGSQEKQLIDSEAMLSGFSSEIDSFISENSPAGYANREYITVNIDGSVYDAPAIVIGDYVYYRAWIGVRRGVYDNMPHEVTDDMLFCSKIS